MARHKHDLTSIPVNFFESKKVKVLDLFCCSGISAEGMLRHNVEVVGVDVLPPSYYPSYFLQSDVRDINLTFMQLFDFVWCSPPCQSNSATWKLHGSKMKGEACMIAWCRDILTRAQVPSIIENVEGAKMKVDFKLCGSMFGLNVKRHRLFECVNWQPFTSPLYCNHERFVNGVHTIAGAFIGSKHDAADSLGCYPCRTRWELQQGVPPAYSEYIMKVFLNKCSG